ncbi:CBS domain-containing protein [Caballeronia sp. BR00000012568055]|uniref:CBS domain-containing protein n=1 Tax=Caballeronia sp. BR00000012568055 TaxID=2918761 RepID=UPI0023F63E2E|nr:CBS domain-containing protein [Caballeronia sp. BR00000012568055]
MRAGQICTLNVVKCDPNTTVLEASKLMRASHVGDVVVVENRHDRIAPLGIVTDRDIAIAVVAEEVEPRSVLVSDIMSAPAVTAFEWEDGFCLPRRMRRLGVRRIAVIDEMGGLIGVVSEDDLLRFIGDYLVELSHVSTRQTIFEEKRRG